MPGSIPGCPPQKTSFPPTREHNRNASESRLRALIALTSGGKTLIEEITARLMASEAERIACIEQPRQLEQQLLQWLEPIEQN